MDNSGQIPPEQTVPERFELVVQADSDNPVELLAQHSRLSKAVIKDAMAKGALWYQSSANPSVGKPRRLRRKSVRLVVGDKLYFYFDSRLLVTQPLQPQLVESYEDFSVWDKPSGMPMLGSKWCDHTSLERWVSVNHLNGGTVYLVHRLDRWTSGLVLVAHSKISASLLAEQFASRQTHKCYRALSVERTGFSRFSDYKLPQEIKTPVDGRSARTIINSVKPATALLNIDSGRKFDAQARSAKCDLKGIWQVDVEIETGRKHQVRKHLAEVGLPVLGDRQYGVESEKESKDFRPDLQLRAVRLSLNYQDKPFDWCLLNDRNQQRP